MHIHKINSHLHQSFLEEDRKDSITGDLIQANDEVVFCGVCKSAFLKDSWEYMNRKHCGQTKTLTSVPISKPLLLNVSRIVPHFITLTNSSISFEECLKMLADFNPRDKKVEILLNPNLKQVLEKQIEQPVKTPIKVKPTTQLRDTLTRRKEQQEEKERQTLLEEKKKNIYLTFASVILGTGISIFPSLIVENFFIRLLIVGTFILLSYFFLLSKRDLLFKNKQNALVEPLPVRNRVNLANSNKEKQKAEKFKDEKIKIEPAMFGIFNHSLFFYFEKTQQGVFIELTRIGEIEIQYQSSCDIHLILKKNNTEEIIIPLIFSKKERITTFLIRLSKTKKNISSRAKVKLTHFPIERIRFLKRKLMLYTDILFIEPEKIEPQKEAISQKTKPTTEPISLEKLINPIDLTTSQKVSKQSKNRNHHHQNRHQTQYKNYKRR